MDLQEFRRWLEDSPWTRIAGSIAYTMLIISLVIVLLGTIAGSCSAQDKDEHYKQLFSPLAVDRTLAAFEYSKLCTVEDLTKILEGYETRYWNGTEYEYTQHPPEPLALIEIINYWPGCIDNGFVDKLYAYENSVLPMYELEHVIAGALSDNALRLDDSGNVGTLVKDYWFEAWIPEVRDVLNGYVWRDLYISIVDTPWLLKMVLDYRGTSIETKYILQAFTGTLDETNPLIYGWAIILQRHLHNDIPLPRDPETSSNYMVTHYTSLGLMRTLDLLAILCDKPEWLPQIKQTMEQPKNLYIRWIQIGPFFVPVHSTAYNELIHSEKLKEDLEKVFLGKDVWTYVGKFDRRALLHHPWFRELRATEGFEKWWNHWNHSIPFEDANPTFGAPNA